MEAPDGYYLIPEWILWPLVVWLFFECLGSGLKIINAWRLARVQQRARRLQKEAMDRIREMDKKEGPGRTYGRPVWDEVLLEHLSHSGPGLSAAQEADERRTLKGIKQDSAVVTQAMLDSYGPNALAGMMGVNPEDLQILEEGEDEP